MRLLTSLALLALSAFSAIAAETSVAFIAGPRSHSSGDHEFNAGCLLLADCLNAQEDLDIEAFVANSPAWKGDEATRARIAAADTIVIYSDATKGIAGEWEFFDKLTKEGKGLLFMHYAVHPSAKEGEQYYRPWIGGAFETGKSVNPHWLADFTVMPDHEIARGVPAVVESYDEWYYNIVFPEGEAAKRIRHLGTATPTPERLKRINNLWNQAGYDAIGKPTTLLWGIEREDGGRGAGFTGGHYHRNWAIDGFRTAVLNTIVWTAGLEVPEGGVKSNAVTEDQLNANLDDYGKENPRILLPNIDEIRALPGDPKLEERTKKEKAKAAPKSAQKSPPASGAKPLFRSEVIKSSDKNRSVDIEIDLPEKTRPFYLVVSDEGDKSHDWANWINPRVLVKGKEVALTHGSWEKATTGHSKVGNNVSSGGKPLSVNGEIQQQGIGVHAPSVLHFTLPWNATKFMATAALDDGGAIRGGKPTPAAVRFLVYDTPPPANAATPAEALPTPGLVTPEKFETLSGLEVTVWATSPMLFNPTNMDTDSDGRIWVTEGVNYRRHAGRRPEGDRIVILEDTTGDGSADKTHTFVQDPKLEAPLGISVLDNKIYVAQPPAMLVYTDHDRDLIFDPSKGDTREEFLTGFNGRQHDHSLHALVAGPDGNFHINQGNTGAMFTDSDGKTFRIGGPYGGGGGTYYHNNTKLGGQLSDDGKIWTGGFQARIKPDGTGTTIIGHGFRNSYESCLSSFGDVFQNDNDDPPACRTSWLMEGGFLGFFSRDGKRTWKADRRPGQDVPTAHWRQDNPGTLPPGDVYGPGSPTGICYYENGALGADHAGMLLSCEARAMTVYGYKPRIDGANFSMERFDFFKATAENMFRPSDVMVGADGAIYVADWYDPGVGGHADRDDTLSGTIYRIAPTGFTPTIAKNDPTTIAGAIALLKSPAVHVRNTGFEALKSMGSDALPAVRALASSSNDHYLAARAVWLLPYLGNDGIQDTLALLEHENPEFRLLALRALRAADHEPLEFGAELAHDPSPAVRRELAVSLRYHGTEKLETVVALFDGYDGEDRTYLEACGLAAEGIETEVWEQLRPESDAPTTWSPAFTNITWRLQSPDAAPALAKRATSDSLTKAEHEFAIDSLAFIRDPAAAQATAEVAASESPAAPYATGWLLRRGYNEWADYGIQDILKERGIYDPETAVATPAPFPEWDEKSNLPPIPDILALEGDAERGKIAAGRCIMCHEVDGQGVDYGPALEGWVANQGADAFLNAVIWPNQSIAHGYDGIRAVLKDKAGEITGLPISTADPIMIQSMGGITQMFPASRLEGGVKPLKRTLMLSADQLGFTAQDLADLTTYMKSY